jgi:hypothetical protein
MAFPYPNSFFLLGFGADQILFGFGCEYGFFRYQKWYGFGLVSEQKRTFLSRILMCLHVIFYDKKQFINQSHKAAIQLEVITINPPLQFKSSQY